MIRATPDVIWCGEPAGSRVELRRMPDGDFMAIRYTEGWFSGADRALNFDGSLGPIAAELVDALCAEGVDGVAVVAERLGFPLASWEGEWLPFPSSSRGGITLA